MRQTLLTTFLSLFVGLFIADRCAADKVFLMTPTDPAKAYPRFHIGVSGIYATIEKGLVVTVDNTEPDTPAAGKFQKGDILVKVNGQPISDPEPYVALGEALTAAEAGDGKLVFTVKRGDKNESVALTVPVLGAYSRTWPLDCKKSDTIVRQAAEFLAQPENLKDPGFFGGLFLLSTGDDQYLPAVKAMVDRNSPDKAGDNTWVNGYAGILIAEYYLRTGDKSALPRLKAICVDAKERQYYGGWCHWTGPVPGYVQGGLMNPAGDRYLTRRSPESLRVTLELQETTYPMWMRLSEAVRNGQPVIAPRGLLGGDPELTRQFVVGMHQRALGNAGALVDAIDFTGHRVLADVGGGPGTYATLMLQRYPGLRARILDLAPILEVARTLVASSGVAALPDAGRYAKFSVRRDL